MDWPLSRWKAFQREGFSLKLSDSETQTKIQTLSECTLQSKEFGCPLCTSQRVLSSNRDLNTVQWSTEWILIIDTIHWIDLYATLWLNRPLSKSPRRLSIRQTFRNSNLLLHFHAFHYMDSFRYMNSVILIHFDEFRYSDIFRYIPLLWYIQPLDIFSHLNIPLPGYLTHSVIWIYLATWIHSATEYGPLESLCDSLLFRLLEPIVRSISRHASPVYAPTWCQIVTVIVEVIVLVAIVALMKSIHEFRVTVTLLPNQLANECGAFDATVTISRTLFWLLANENSSHWEAARFSGFADNANSRSVSGGKTLSSITEAMPELFWSSCSVIRSKDSVELFCRAV